MKKDMNFYFGSRLPRENRKLLPLLVFYDVRVVRIFDEWGWNIYSKGGAPLHGVWASIETYPTEAASYQTAINNLKAIINAKSDTTTGDPYRAYENGPSAEGRRISD